MKIIFSRNSINYSVNTNLMHQNNCPVSNIL